MKEITKTSRLAGQLEKLFNMINSDWFNGELETPIITIQSTPKAYGHVTVSGNAWTVKNEGKRELNIGAGTLYRPIEETVATLMHECCHIYDIQNNIPDVSNNGRYHNKAFRKTAEEHGLIVECSGTFGHAVTSASDDLIEWICNNNIPEIMLTRNEYSRSPIGGNGGSYTPTTGTQKTKTTSNSRRYVCPCCGTKVRATKAVNLICGDCMQAMIES